MKKITISAALMLLGTMITFAQAIDFSDSAFKDRLINHNPVIDTNGNGEIEVSEAELVELLTLDNFDDQEKITDLSGLENFVALQTLYISRNEIEILDISQLPNLTEIGAFQNKINSFTPNSALEIFQATDNLIESFSTASLPNLIKLNLSDNPLTSLDVGSSNALEELEINGTPLTNVNVSNLTNLRVLVYGGPNFQVIDTSNNIGLFALIVVEVNFNTLDTSNLENLSTFAIESSQISSLDFSENPNLFGISISDSPLTAINFENNNFLDLIVLRNVDLTTLDVSNVNLLSRLRLFNSPLNSINYPTSGSLSSLTVKNLDLNTIDAQHLSELTFLSISSCPLDSYDFDGLESLNSLSIENADIIDIDLSNLLELNSLRLENTEITTLDLSLYPSINSLRLKNNQSLQSLSLKNLLFASDNSPEISNNFDLEYICVDDINYAIENFIDVQSGVTYIEDCNLANTNRNTIEGSVIYDDESNGCETSDEVLSGLTILTSDGDNIYGTSTSEIGFIQSVGEGDFETTITNLPLYFTITPAAQTNTFTGFDQVANADFCITSSGDFNDLSVVLMPLSDARPGFQADYSIVYENKGTTTLNGEVTFSFDNNYSEFQTSTPNASNVTSELVTWNFIGLQPFENRIINLTTLIEQPPTVEDGDILALTAVINSETTDETNEDNSFNLDQLVVNSFDPNDKRVLEGEEIHIENADQFLHYIIRFQNVGSASAINVRILDNIDEDLDVSTLEIISASHDYLMRLINNSVEFSFDGIELPAEIDDAEGSNGYIAFKIKVVPEAMQVGTIIRNQANIYFDFNAPIITNIVETTLVDNLGISEVNSIAIKIFPNPTKDLLTITNNSPLGTITVTNILGQVIYNEDIRETKKTINLSNNKAGIYFIKIKNEHGTTVNKIIKQ